jgi:iron(III) transport system permease protein
LTTTWQSRAAVVLVVLASAVAVAPVLVMMARVFIEDGSLSLGHLAAAYEDLLPAASAEPVAAAAETGPPRLLILARNSLIVVLGTVAVAFAFGGPLGFLSARTDLPGRRLLVWTLVLAAAVPPFLTTGAWLTLGGTTFWFYQFWGVAWIQGMAYLPHAALLCAVVFATTDTELEEAALQDASSARVVWRVVLPLSARGLVAAVLAVAVLAIQDITVSDILMVRTWPEEVFSQWQMAVEPAQATAIALPQMALLAALLLVVAAAWRAHGMSWAAVARPPRRLRLGGWRWLAGELGATLMVVPPAALLAATLAVPWAWALHRGGWLRAVVGGLLVLLLAAPAPVVGIGTIEIFNRPGVLGEIYDTPLVAVLVFVTRTLPFAVLVVYPAITRLPTDLGEAARLEGCSLLRYAASVLTPLCWRAVLAASCLSAILATGDLGASVLVVPPGFTTLAIRFFTLVHYGVYPSLAGMCLTLMFGVMLPAAVVIALLWRRLSNRWL